MLIWIYKNPGFIPFSVTYNIPTGYYGLEVDKSETKRHTIYPTHPEKITLFVKGVNNARTDVPHAMLLSSRSKSHEINVC